MSESSIKCDVVIVGAGPCGLFQVFELGLLDLHAHVVDSLPQVGGQCAELYPEKPIYDIPAYPVIGAQELIDNLMAQIKPFNPTFHLGQEVSVLEQRGERWRLVTSKGTEFDTAAVVIAGGLGSFQPKRLRLPSAEQFEGSQLHYKVREREQFAGQDVVILGGGDSALDWALDLAEIAGSLTVVHRRTEYRAQHASVNRLKALEAEGKAKTLHANVTGLIESDGRLTGLELLMPEGGKSEMPVEQLLVFWGLHPNLGPIAEWELDIEKRQIQVSTETFETNRPGIYAVGDINTYPGKKKLILSGFHEAALAAFAIRKRLHPDERQFLQYTTTSPVMHKRLGVD